MKEMYHSSTAKNTVKISLKSKGRTFDIYFQLNDNPVQNLWQQTQIQKNNFFTFPMTNIGLEKNLEKLNYCLNSIGKESLTLPIDQYLLNQIHAEFTDSKNSDSQVWQMINLYIHNIENTKNDPFVDYNCSVTFIRQPETDIFPILEEYKLWLTTEHHWGDLILGYGTLGKDYIEICKDNDTTDELALQNSINSETCLFFHLENPYRKFEEKNFYPWAKSKNINLNNLNNLSLGKYILGQIIITEIFLDFHPNISDWYVPNHICKLRWNKEFLGSDTEVTAIDFFDSDMYYNSVIKHSKLDSII